MKEWTGLYEIRYTGMSHETYYVGAAGLCDASRSLWRRWRDYVLILKNYNLKCTDNVMPMMKFLHHCVENDLDYDSERNLLEIRWYPMFRCADWTKENAKRIFEKESKRRMKYGDLPGHGGLKQEVVENLVEKLNQRHGVFGCL